MTEQKEISDFLPAGNRSSPQAEMDVAKEILEKPSAHCPLPISAEQLNRQTTI